MGLYRIFRVKLLNFGLRRRVFILLGGSLVYRGLRYSGLGFFNLIVKIRKRSSFVNIWGEFKERTLFLSS